MTRGCDKIRAEEWRGSRVLKLTNGHAKLCKTSRCILCLCFSQMAKWGLWSAVGPYPTHGSVSSRSIASPLSWKALRWTRGKRLIFKDQCPSHAVWENRIMRILTRPITRPSRILNMVGRTPWRLESGICKKKPHRSGDFCAHIDQHVWSNKFQKLK